MCATGVSDISVFFRRLNFGCVPFLFNVKVVFVGCFDFLLFQVLCL